MLPTKRQGILFNKNILKQKTSKFKPDEIKEKMKEAIYKVKVRKERKV